MRCPQLGQNKRSLEYVVLQFEQYITIPFLEMYVSYGIKYAKNTPITRE